MALLAGCGAPAASDGGPTATPVAEWRHIAWTPTDTTSRCIGRPDTPLCAVETLLACFQRGRIELCRQVDDRTDEYAQAFATPADPGRMLTYRVTGNQTVTEAAAEGRIQPGDVAITIDQREAAPSDPPGPTTKSAFLLRRGGEGHWRIVTWGEPGAD